MAENKRNVAAEEAKKEETQQPPKKSNKERLKDITASIEVGIKELFESGKYKEYLAVMSRFHHYSVNNQVLIHMQNPNATHVAGFNKWRDQFGRNVKKGEKGIKIIAPTPYKKKIEEAKLDPDTKLPMVDDNGKIITEEKEIQVPMFRVVSVFDVSQTAGKPLPQLANDITGNVENYDAFLEAIKRSSTVPIKFEPLGEHLDGYFSTTKQEIVIRDGMSEVQTVSALLHEMAHSKLHNAKAADEKLQEVELFGEKALYANHRIKDADVPDGLYRYDLRGSDNDPGIPCTVEAYVKANHAGSVITAEPIDFQEDGFIQLDDNLNFLGSEKGMREFQREQHPDKAKLSRNDEEVQAESISYSVCAFFGIKTDDNSLGYIASWSKNKEVPELKKSLEIINKASSGMIDDIEKNYAEVRKERGLDNTVQDLDEAMFENSVNYLYIQRLDERWDYSVYDKESLHLVDVGRIDNPALRLDEVKEQIALEYEVKLPYSKPLPENDKNRLLDDISEKAAMEMTQEHQDLPDPQITIADMRAYGYTDANMLPLTEETAQKLFDMDAAIYMLHYDNSEAMVTDVSEIKTFDGIFGIDKEDWQSVKGDYLKTKDNYLKNAEMTLEDDYDMLDGIAETRDNKSVAELERDVMDGKSISLLELADAINRENAEQKPAKQAKSSKRDKAAKSEKPSLLAKLNRPLPPQQDKEKPKNKEMEM